MRKVLAGALGCVALVLMSPTTSGAQAEVDVQVTEVGWWTSNPASVPQSEGGFQVSADATGAPQAVAALRVLILATSVETLAVHLDELSSVGTEFGTLKLCGTADAWTAANPGSFDDAPEPDCSVSAGLTRTLEGVWLGEASALAPNGGEVTLMVVPNYRPPAAIGPPFSVSISGGDLSATSSGSPTTTLDGTGSGNEPVAVDDTTDFFGPSSGGSFGIGDLAAVPDFGTVSPEPPPTTASVVAPSDPADDEEFALQPLDEDREPGPPWLRLVVLVPLSAGLGVGAARLRKAMQEGLFGAA